ncbi:MAG: NIF family HAD-type phosphatase [Spirochaetes bacterium]|nr:NIF family HAD-type phosphatase [Spirochaetota bacterium]
MTIVFDLDNTLVDEFGAGTRPGVVKLLEKLRADGHRLVLWTNSRRDRARETLGLHDLRRHFVTIVCREDYDPLDAGVRKDIRRIRGDLLVDDSPEEIAYQKSIGKKGYLLKPFRKGRTTDSRELLDLYAFIRRTR